MLLVTYTMKIFKRFGIVINLKISNPFTKIIGGKKMMFAENVSIVPFFMSKF